MKKSLFILLLPLLNFFLVYSQDQEEQLLYFRCENNLNKKGIFIISPIIYSDEKDFGFDFGTYGIAKVEKDALTANSPVYFSIKVPEGNYQIEVVLGSDKKPSVTTVKAESRRVMLKEVHVPKGDSRTETFMVNVRTPLISSTEKINLKSRELDDLNWDNKLTLEFSGQMAVKSVSIVPLDNMTTLYLAGDSTVTDQDLEPWASWGQMITQYFDTGVVVANYAASGESLGSFKGRKRLDKILSLIQDGDYLFIEFGHNDEKIKGEGNGAYGLYSRLLREYVTAARNKGAIPVLLTPTQRRHFNSDGRLNSTHGDFPDAMRKVATELDVPLIDLTKITTKMYESWGMEDSKSALVHYSAHTFPGQDKELADNTHFNTFGANEIALAIIGQLRKSDLDLKNHIRKETPHYNPNHPNDLLEWTLPMSPRFESTKPEGN